MTKYRIRVDGFDLTPDNLDKTTFESPQPLSLGRLNMIKNDFAKRIGIRSFGVDGIEIYCGSERVA